MDPPMDMYWYMVDNFFNDDADLLLLLQLIRKKKGKKKRKATVRSCWVKPWILDRTNKRCGNNIMYNFQQELRVSLCTYLIRQYAFK